LPTEKKALLLMQRTSQ